MVNYEPKDSRIKADELGLLMYLSDIEDIEVESLETDPSYCTIFKWKGTFTDSDGGDEDGLNCVLLEKIEKRFHFKVSSIFSDGVIVFHHEEARAMWQRRCPVYNA